MSPRIYPDDVRVLSRLNLALNPLDRSLGLARYEGGSSRQPSRPRECGTSTANGVPLGYCGTQQNSTRKICNRRLLGERGGRCEKARRRLVEHSTHDLLGMRRVVRFMVRFDVPDPGPSRSRLVVPDGHNPSLCCLGDGLWYGSCVVVRSLSRQTDSCRSWCSWSVRIHAVVDTDGLDDPTKQPLVITEVGM